jgi:hypothetical protein
MIYDVYKNMVWSYIILSNILNISTGPVVRTIPSLLLSESKMLPIIADVPANQDRDRDYQVIDS